MFLMNLYSPQKRLIRKYRQTEVESSLIFILYSVQEFNSLSDKINFKVQKA